MARDFAQGSVRPKAPEISREEAIGRAQTWKRIVAWGTVVGFFVLWQAAANHVTGVTSRSSSGAAQTQLVPGASQGFEFGSGGAGMPMTQTAVS